MAIRIDIISDVVCPWCAIGYYQLDAALKDLAVEADIRWLPFELNPNMPAEGQDVLEHVAEKYGATPQASKAARARITQAGAEVGFTFNYADDARIWNTFLAHRLLHAAAGTDKQTPLKLALFKAYFTDGRNISDLDVLKAVAKEAGFDAAWVDGALAGDNDGAQTRHLEGAITSQGVHGVPAMIFDEKYLVSGAQGTDAYKKVLTQVIQEAEAESVA